jgi:phage replication O-like protein O
MKELGHVEWKVFCGVVRMTYGYNRKEADVSVALLSGMCKMSIRQVKEALSRLVARRVLYVRRNGPKPMTISIEKDYDLWEKRGAESRTSMKRGAESRTSRGAESRTSRASYHIDERQKKKTVPRTPSEEALKVARGYHARIRALYPTLTKTMNERTDVEGAQVLDDLVRIDGHDWEEVKRTLRWALTDAFWSKNLRSLAGARKKVSGSGGATKFENCMAKMLETTELVRGAMARPAPVTRTWADGEKRSVPNCLGFKDSTNGQDEGKLAREVGKAG